MRMWVVVGVYAQRVQGEKAAVAPRCPARCPTRCPAHHASWMRARHEWFFRSGLDHLVWVFGMLCAFFFPNFDTSLQRLDALNHTRRLLAKSAVVAGSLLLGGWWYANFFAHQHTVPSIGDQ